MKDAPTQNSGESVPDKRDYTPGLLPEFHNTVRSEVLAALLRGDVMTGLDSVFAHHTTRLAAVICALGKEYGWPILRHEIAVNTKDGRSVRIVGYYLHPTTIKAAASRGSRQWVAAVKAARAKQKQQARQSKRGVGQEKELRQHLRQHDPRQLSLWGAK